MMTLLGSSCEDLALKRGLGRSPFKPNLVIFLLVQHQPKLLFPSASSGLLFCSPQSPKPSSSIDPGAEPRPGTDPGEASVSLHPLPLSPDLGSAFRAAPEGRGPCFSSAVSCPGCSASEQSGQERALSRPEGTRGLSPAPVEQWLLPRCRIPSGKVFARSFPALGHLKEMLLGFAVLGREISACSGSAWVCSPGGVEFGAFAAWGGASPGHRGGASQAPGICSRVGGRCPGRGV